MFQKNHYSFITNPIDWIGDTLCGLKPTGFIKCVRWALRRKPKKAHDNNVIRVRFRVPTECEPMAEDNDLDRDFEREEDLLSFVETRVSQINRELDDLERTQFTEQMEDFDEHWEKIYGEITKLQGIVKNNYVRFVGGEDKIENWEEIDMYSLTITLMERLTEIKDTNTVGV